MQDEQKLKRRRAGSTKKALCLTVVTDVGFFHDEPSQRRILGFRFSKRDYYPLRSSRYILYIISVGYIPLANTIWPIWSVELVLSSST